MLRYSTMQLMQLMQRQRGAGRVVPLLVLVVAGVLAAGGIAARIAARQALKRETAELAVPGVLVTRPKAGGNTHGLTLPATVVPVQEAAIYARTSGYLKAWHVDIGSTVTAGQLLAEIDTPEVDAQLVQAAADLRTAEANYKLAQSTAQRWTELGKTHVVAQQSIDEKQGDADARKAALESARANLQRLQKQGAFKRIEAPFAGVVTARSADVGRLVDAGGSSADRELFHIADTRVLRIYANVPEAYAADVKPGLAATIELAAYPGRRLAGNVVRSADALDPATRTLRTEIDLDNADLALLPGGYAEVHLPLDGAADALRVPSTALLFRADGLHVATVLADDRVKLKTVKLGRDYGNEIEVLAGLSPDDRVVLSPPDALVDGVQVKVAEAAEK